MSHRMSDDRVKFFLHSKYYNFTNYGTRNGMNMANCQIVLQKSFNIGLSESVNLFRNNPTGFTIICRPSQFARFIVNRYKFGNCINGVRDLEPELFFPTPPQPQLDYYQTIAEKVGFNFVEVSTVLEAAGVPNRPPECLITVRCGPTTHQSVLDVSKNHAVHKDYTL